LVERPVQIFRLDDPIKNELSNIVHERKSMNTTNPTTAHNETDERILLVIHNAVQNFGYSFYMIGDVILTDQCFCFIQYADITDPYLLFGLVGGIISVLAEDNRIASLKKDADRVRRGLYGLRLHKRINLKGPIIKSMVLSLADVRILQVQNETQLSLTKQDGNQYNYLVPAMNAQCQKVVNNWPKSESLYDSSSDPDGFFVGSSSPREMLLRIANGDDKAASEIYQLGLRENYMTIIFANLQHLQDHERRNVFNRFSHGPVEFRMSVLAVAGKIAHDSKRNLIIGIILLIVFGFFGIIAISTLSVGSGIPAIIGIILGLSGFINSRRGRRVANEAKTCLNGLP
jgi:hypothetical protein